jgi:hypothetical protein
MHSYLVSAGLVLSKLFVLSLTIIAVYAITEAVFPGHGNTGVIGALGGWILSSD